MIQVLEVAFAEYGSALAGTTPISAPLMYDPDALNKTPLGVEVYPIEELKDVDGINAKGS